jgi:hypothetical protein
MVGYLEQDNRKAALFLLPNHQVMLASLGSVIGQERGVIANIDREKVMIRLQNGKIWVSRLLKNKPLRKLVAEAV